MPTLPLFWSMLEANFHSVLQDYTLDRDGDEIRAQWFHRVREALVDAWNSHKTSVSSGDAWAIRALVKADGQVSRQIAELGKNIRALEAVA
jgi:CRISPR system Cascade subunit CasA